MSVLACFSFVLPVLPLRARSGPLRRSVHPAGILWSCVCQAPLPTVALGTQLLAPLLPFPKSAMCCADVLCRRSGARPSAKHVISKGRWLVALDGSLPLLLKDPPAPPSVYPMVSSDFCGDRGAALPQVRALCCAVWCGVEV